MRCDILRFRVDFEFTLKLVLLLDTTSVSKSELRLEKHTADKLYLFFFKQSQSVFLAMKDTCVSQVAKLGEADSSVILDGTFLREFDCRCDMANIY